MPILSALPRRPQRAPCPKALLVLILPFCKGVTSPALDAFKSHLRQPPPTSLTTHATLLCTFILPAPPGDPLCGGTAPLPAASPNSQRLFEGLHHQGAPKTAACSSVPGEDGKPGALGQ